MKRRKAAKISPRDYIVGYTGHLPLIAAPILKTLTVFSLSVQRWQRTRKLVSAGNVEDLWIRHVLDSLQIFTISPESVDWLDVGSGGGFPSLVIAGFLKNNPLSVVACVESDKRKSAFLASCSRALGLPVKIYPLRFELVNKALQYSTKTITFRAVAQTAQVINHIRSLTSTRSICIIQMGNADGRYNQFLGKTEFELFISVTNDQSDIVVIRSYCSPIPQ